MTHISPGAVKEIGINLQLIRGFFFFFIKKWLYEMIAFFGLTNRKWLTPSKLYQVTSSLLQLLDIVNCHQIQSPRSP